MNDHECPNTERSIGDQESIPISQSDSGHPDLALSNIQNYIRSCPGYHDFLSKRHPIVLHGSDCREMIEYSMECPTIQDFH